MRRYRKVLLGAGLAMGMTALAPAGAAGPQTPEQEEAPAHAEAGQPTQNAAVEKEPVDPDKRVCKRTEVTGSRFPKVVCHTQAQWDDMAQGTRSKMQEIGSMRVSANGQGESADSTGP